MCSSGRFKHPEVAIALAVSSVALSISSFYYEVDAYTHGHFANNGVTLIAFSTSILLSAAGVWISLRSGRYLLTCVVLAAFNLLVHIFMPACFGALEAALVFAAEKWRSLF